MRLSKKSLKGIPMAYNLKLPHPNEGVQKVFQDYDLLTNCKQVQYFFRAEIMSYDLKSHIPTIRFCAICLSQNQMAQIPEWERLG